MRFLVRSSALLALLLMGTGASFFSDPGHVAKYTTARWENSEIGTVWSDNFNRGTLGTNWGLYDGVSVTMTNGELLVNDGGGYLLYKPWFISSDAWTIHWTEHFPVLNSTSYGIGVGLLNLQMYGGTNRAYNAILSGTGGWKGELVIEKLQNDGLQGYVTAGPALDLAAGDVVECWLTRAGWDMTATASNRANGQVTSSTFTYDIPSQHDQPTISGVCIYGEGGAVYLDDLSFTINRRKPARCIVIGDSVSDGYEVSAYAAEYRSILQSNLTDTVCNDSSSYNVTSNALSVLPEILAHQPGTAILMIGGNDVFLGVPTAQWKAQYASLVAQLQANGVGIIHCLPTPRNNVNLTQLKTWITTNYAGAKIIDTWTPFLSGTSGLKAAYDSGDGVHPNDAGHFLIGAILSTNVP